MHLKAKIGLIVCLLGMLCGTSAYADKVCLKVTISKKGKVTTSRKVAATCPRGFTEVGDTANSQKVLAGNVVLGSSNSLLLADENSVGRLKSKNLKEALEDELAFDIFNLAGSRWSVENLNQVGQNYFTAQGEIRFENNSTVIVTSGTVEAIGSSLEDEEGTPDWCKAKSYTLSFISPAIASIAASDRRGVLQISVLNKNQMVWTGQVPCGSNSLLNVSKLTRIVN